LARQDIKETKQVNRNILSKRRWCNLRITNAVLAEKIDALDKNVTGINARLDKLNGRTFKNSTDIAKLKTSNGIVATFISMVVAGVISFIGWKAR